MSLNCKKLASLAWTPSSVQRLVAVPRCHSFRSERPAGLGFLNLGGFAHRTEPTSYLARVESGTMLRKLDSKWQILCFPIALRGRLAPEHLGDR